MADLSSITLPNNQSYNLKDAKARVYTDTVALTTAWSGSGPYTQTVTLGHYTPTANSKVDLQPNEAAIAQLVSDNVKGLYIVNTNGTLTMCAVGGVPTAAMLMQVSITEVTPLASSESGNQIGSARVGLATI